MIGLFCFVLAVLASPFESKLRLEAENAVLRHQLIVLKRRFHGRVRLTNHDRWFLIQLYRWFPSILKVLAIIRPTLVRWHKAGFRRYWRWKQNAYLLPQCPNLCLDRCPRPTNEPEKISHYTTASPDSRSTSIVRGFRQGQVTTLACFVLFCTRGLRVQRAPGIPHVLF
jgi:hypothetical protein